MGKKSMIPKKKYYEAPEPTGYMSFLASEYSLSGGQMQRYPKGCVCEICGRADWCGFYVKTFRNGKFAVFICCHRLDRSDLRASPDGDGVTLRNGSRFVYDGQTSGGFYRFQDYPSWKRNQDWLEYSAAHPDKAKAATYSSKKKELDVAALKAQAEAGGYKRTAPANRSELREIEHLDVVYRELLSLLKLEDCDVKELTEHDAWDDKLMQRVLAMAPIRSNPPEDWRRFDEASPRHEQFARLRNFSRKKLVAMLQEKFGAEGLAGVPGFYKKKNGDWTFIGQDGYLIPQYTIEGLISGLRLRVSDGARTDRAKSAFARMSEAERRDYAECSQIECSEEAIVRKLSKSYGKYIAFSAPNYEGGCECKSQLSFYGLQYLGSRYDKLPVKRVVVCEGEKKGIITSLMWGYLVISLPGVQQFRLLDRPVLVSKDWQDGPLTAFEWLRSKGVTNIAVANDTDMSQNDVVASATMDTLSLIKERGFIPEIVTWDPRYKGIDDCLIAKMKTTVKRFK